MCGIVGYVGAREAAPVLLDGLSRLEYRGYDSAGIAVQDEALPQIHIVKTAGRVKGLTEMTDGGRAAPGRCGVGHTRWATHGEASARNAHPHASPDGRVALVHNGVIGNHRAIREQLLARGARFASDTDTEAAALLLHALYAGQDARAGDNARAIGAIGEMMRVLEGSYALAILFADQPGVVYAAKKGSPLLLGRCDRGDGCILASDAPALLPYARCVIPLEDMEIAAMTARGIEVFSRDGRRREREAVVLAWDARAAEKGGHAHYMMKEICEEPAAVGDTLAPRVKTREDGLRDVDLRETGLTREALAGVRRVLLVGCGSAYHAGRIALHALEALAHVPCAAEIASELGEREALLREGTLAVVISQSGETADSLAALRLCRKKGVRTLAVVNVPGSSIAREADALLVTHAGPEISVATTKAYCAQLAALYLLAIDLACARRAIGERQADALLGEMLALPETIKKSMCTQEKMAALARRTAAVRDAFFIGRGMDGALCMEGSLKLKEISGVHSEAYAAGELKHGAISLIEKGTLVIALATQPQALDRLLGAVAQARSRGAYVVLITTLFAKAQRELAQAAEEIICLPDVPALFAPLPAVVPLQLFAYHAACVRGMNVDHPKNLAKSVTVE